MNALNSYFDAVQRCTFQFQWIEVSLKMAIGLSKAVIKQQLKGIIDYRPEKERLDKFTLGKLVETYDRFGGEQALVEELRQCVKERNDLAHEAFVLSEEEQKSEAFLHRRTEELQTLYGNLGAIVRQLQARIISLNDMLKTTPNPEGRVPR